MHVIRVRNVQEALPVGLRHLEEVGIDRNSRNGPVKLFPGPVTTVYERPRERVIYHQERDANPFFHLFESLWMLAGRDDVKYVAHFVKRMKTFSDDGKTLHGAYGKRWLDWFGADLDASSTMYQDQLLNAIEALKHNPDDRRQVISMWDGHVDPNVAAAGGKDVPCNTHIYVWVDTDGRLSMTLSNRSNDMVWGAYGANAVHFSYLQEFLATGVGVEVGRFYQVSNNLHAYHDTLKGVESLGRMAVFEDPYSEGLVEPYPLVSTDIKTWREDLSVFFDIGPAPGLRDPFFRRVAIPMWLAHEAYKSSDDIERFELAFHNLSQCHAADWRMAANEWLVRRFEAQMKREDEAANVGE